MKTLLPSHQKSPIPRIALALACFAPLSSHAAERHWIDTVGTAFFNNSSNWSATSGGAGGASVPVAADNANFDLAGTYTVAFTAAHTNTNLEIEEGTVIFDLGNFTYTLSGTVRVGVTTSLTSARLTLFDGTLDVDTSGDDITIGAVDADGFLTVSTGGIIGAGGTNPDIRLGDGGDGTLTINNGGVVNSSSGTFGLSSTLSSGTAVVTGLGSRWISSGSLIVGSTGSGSLSVQSGATVSGNSSSIGNGPNAIGNATVTGAGSTWTESASLVVGNTGAGALSISSGGAVTVATDAFIAGASGSFGTVSVSGTNSRWDIGDRLVVANSGQASLTISSGGEVTASTLTIADTSGTTTDGSVTITGTGSTLRVTGAADVGDDDLGSLTVASGGSLVTLAGLDIGNNITGVGEVTVTGANARWTNTGALNIANLGFGTLTVENGGAVTTTSLNLNDPAGGNVGRLVFDGGTITTGNFTRAAAAPFDWTDGTLNVANGLFNNASANLIINGADAADLPTLHLSGTSTGSGFGATTLTLGTTRAGALRITGLASLSVATANLGTQDGGSGSLEVSGNGAAFTATGVLAVGGTGGSAGGAGTLDIGAGGSVNANTLQLWTGGTVNLNGGTLQLAGFSEDGGQFNFNAGAVVFTGAGYSGAFGAVYDALLGFEHRLTAGRQIEYDGNFSFFNMNLVIDGGTFVQGGTLTVNNNAILDVRSGLLIANTLAGNINGQIVLGGGIVTLTTTFTNPGELRLAAASDFSLITGTTLTNTGLIHGNGQVGMALANNSGGEVRVAAGGRMVFTGASSNNGTGRIQVTAGGDLQFTSTLANNSLVDVIGGTFRVQGAATNAASTGLIAGRNAVMWFDGGLTNGGSLAFGSGVNDIFGDIVNSPGGRIIVSGGAAAIFYDDITNSGSINVSASGPLSSVAVFFGALSGGGVAGTGQVFIEGDARPGASPGVMSFGGDVSFGPLARTIIELGGTSPGTQYDRLTVAGSTSLGGVLDVRLINGFTPSAGQTFDILDTTTQSGAFTSIILPTLPAGLFWRTERLYTDGTLTVCPIPGTFAEYSAFHGLGGLTGDDDGDGESNALDFLLGQNPRTATQAGSPAGGYDGSTFTFDFDMPDLPAATAVYHIETSTDLISWTARATRTGPGPWTGPAAGAITVTPLGNCSENVAIALAPAGAPRFFVRLRGELAP